MWTRQIVEQREGEGRATHWVLLIGLLSGALYVVVYFAQRAIYLNGLPWHVAGAVEQAAPASRRALLWEAIVYYATTLALFALYAWLLALCRRGRLHDRRARNLALLFPVLFNVGLLFGRPYLAGDVLAYIDQGYVGAMPGGELYYAPLPHQLELYGYLPGGGFGPYGPLWSHVEIAVVLLTQVVRFPQNVPIAILLLKAVVVVASLLCGALIWAILGRVRPADQLLGALVYLWCPMIVVEFAGEGHNDALMILFVLLALLLAFGKRPTASLPAMTLAALTKYVPVLFLPAQLVYLWRTQRNRSHLALQLLVGIAIGLSLTILLYRQLWAGAATFVGVRNWLGAAGTGASNAHVLFWYFSHHGHSSTEAAQLTLFIVAGVFGVYLLITSLAVRDSVGLLKVCAGISLAYLLVATPGYYPWYAAMPLALMALYPHGAFRWLIFLLPLGSRLVAPFDDILANFGWISFVMKGASVSAITLTLPLLVWLWVSALEWRQRFARAHREQAPQPQSAAGQQMTTPAPSVRMMLSRTLRKIRA